MKAVLLPIWPQYCELIANGKKTVEVRKNRPKIETPFKCYIYQTMTGYVSKSKENDILVPTTYGKVIGEFVCDGISKFTAEFVNDDCYEDIRFLYTNVYGEEVERVITSNERDNPSDCWLCKESCLSFEDIKNYIGVNFHTLPFYGWHISDLVIYDKPKELGEFHRPCTPACNYSEECGGTNATDCLFGISRAPQSWCYVEVVA